MSKISKFGVGASILIMLLISLAGYLTTSSMIGTMEERRQTRIAAERLAELLSHVKDAETGQRGFLLTAHEAYLAPYTAARHVIETDLQNLEAAASTEPAIALRLARIRQLTFDKLAELELTIGLRRAQGLNAALQTVEQGQGLVLMNALRVEIGLANQDVQRALDEKDRVSTVRARTAILAILCGGAIGVAAMAASLSITRRQMRLR
ncbi:MAG TPA: CHASE3 domain-containing protein, partial [Polyangiaceae bacterium]|nr:CHASE3 domain-containing protein [Polyangiaceae bacterium]